QRQETTWFWSPDGNSLVTCTQEIATRRGEFWRIRLDGGPPEILLADDRAFNAGPTSPISSAFGDVSADGNLIVYAAEDETQPPEFWAADARFQQRRQVTHRNAHLAEAALGRSRLVSWTSVGGRRIQGALLLPADVQPGRPVPLVVGLYPGLNLSDGLHRWAGGMLWAVVHRQQLVSRGYAVLCADVPAPEPARPPEEALAGIIMPGVQRLVEEGVADGEHLAAIGQSAGGRALLQLLTQTPIFGAAVVCSAGGNLSSIFGQLRLNPDGSPDMYGIHNAEGWCGGPPWEQPLRYIQESPIFALDRIRTPVLLICGTEDTAVGAEQVGEVFVGLRRLEKEVTLLRYHGEGHVPSAYGEANRRDVTDRVLAWLAAHLG
ncbi:MAG: prolyl oligopeptidase family serine peptidase, partial [Chloroflexota bacterium]